MTGCMTWIRRRLFTFSIKRRIRRFHFIVVQWTSKKCTKKLDAREATVVFMLKPIVFWRCRRGGWDFHISDFFFGTNSRGCYKNYKYITKTRRRKPANYINPDQRWNVRSGQRSLGFRVGHLSSLQCLNDWVHDLWALKLRRRIPSQFQLREYIRQVLPLNTILTREKWNWSVPSRDGLVLV